MRLVTCVAIELGVGAVLAVGAVVAAMELSGRLDGGAVALAAATSSDGHAVRRAPPHLPAELPRVVDERVAAAAPPARPGSGTFEGRPDELLLAPLKSAAVAEIKFNRGGSSLSLRVDFADGSRAAFKPDQTNLQTIPRREVAAYRIARLLGLSNVAPAIGRRFGMSELEAALRPDARPQWPRFLAEAVRVDGQVTGELTHWIPDIVDAKYLGHRVDSTEGIVAWSRVLTIGTEIAPADVELMSQISQMVLFDFVIGNPDRWSGHNTKGSADGHVLYFMDHGMALTPARGHSRTRTYLERSQRFSRSLVEHLRALDQAALEAALSWDVEPFPYLLTGPEIRAILARRDAALVYVDGLVELHGAAAVLAFP